MVCGGKNKAALEEAHINPVQNSSPGKQQSRITPDESTAALVDSIIPLVLPIVRKAVCSRLITDGSVLYNENPVTSYEEDKLPIETIKLKIDDVLVMDRKTMKNDMKEHTDFDWPEQKKAMELMKNVPGKGREMIVLEFVGLDCMVYFGAGFEFKFPLNLPAGRKGSLEVGSGGSIKRGWFRLMVPRIRFWFVSSSRKCYIAFMEKPQLTPNFHANLDKGKGDFMNIEFTEDGSLDDLVETLLSRFGPMSKDSKKTAMENDAKVSVVGVSVGKLIAQLAKYSMGGSIGKNAPLEVDMTDTIQQIMDVAMGIPRSVSAIEADIEVLQKELERAKQAERDASDVRDDGGNCDGMVDEVKSTKTRELKSGRHILGESNVFCGWGV